jgi:hypothetical protein
MAGHDARNNAFATLLRWSASPFLAVYNQSVESTNAQSILGSHALRDATPVEGFVTLVHKTCAESGLHELSFHRKPLLVNGSSTSLRSSSVYITRSSTDFHPFVQVQACCQSQNHAALEECGTLRNKSCQWSGQNGAKIANYFSLPLILPFLRPDPRFGTTGLYSRPTFDGHPAALWIYIRYMVLTMII